MKEKRIQVVDDDPSINELVRLYLEREGYQVSTCARGDTAWMDFQREMPDLVVLDVMLPGLDGWQVLKNIRKSSKTPVIMLTARDETFDKVLGLELGADDYVTKPFDPKELTARVKAVLRRTQGEEEEQPEKKLTFPQLTISLDSYEVFYEGKRVEMPPKELEILYYLAANKGQVFTRDQLLDRIWGFENVGAASSSRTVDVHIKRVREKLPGCEQYGWEIKTIWGVGYKFEVLA